MKTFLPAEVEDNKRGWVLIDVENKALGRAAVQIANVLRGRNKAAYCPHIDIGDFVVVINAKKVKLTGRKEDQKVYQRFTGYRSGQKEMTASALRQKHPDDLVKLAVRGMLPRNHQSRTLMKRLKVYAGAEHPHAAQKPAV